MSLDSNKLPFLPQEIWELTKLKHVYLGFNKLPFLPKEIRKLTKLESLSLKQNNITSIFDGEGKNWVEQVIENHKNLTYINLESTPFDEKSQAALNLLNEQCKKTRPRLKRMF